MVLEKTSVSTWDLEQTDIFANLSDYALDKIARACQSDAFEPGDIIFTEGSVAENVYLLVEGQVALETQVNGVQQGTNITLETINKCHIFGWSALTEPQVPTVTCRCTHPSRVITINARDLKAIFEECPQIGYVVMKNLNAVVSSRLTGTRLGLQREIRQLLLRDW